MQDDGWILEVKEELSSMAADEEASMDTPSTWLGDPLLGRAIEHGRYHVEQALGWGGSSTVYKVRRVLTGQHRAMKVLHRNLMFDDEAQERFIVEARLLDQLDHPNIVRYYDAGLLEETEQPYLLMEMLEGQSLHDAIWATGEPLLPPPEDAVILSIQIASALAHAHARGVLHRDLKPENVILMTPHEEHPRIIPRVKLIDFGIAASLDADTHPEDVILGTPEYAAPEQFEDRATFDARLDIYQLGAVLHFMLTGRTPHPEGDDNFLKVYVAQLTYKDGPGPRPSRLRPELQRYIGLDALVARMLSNDRDLRPMTASDALEALEHCLKVDFEAIYTDRVGHALRGFDGTSQASSLLQRLSFPPPCAVEERPQLAPRSMTIKAQPWHRRWLRLVANVG